MRPVVLLLLLAGLVGSAVVPQEPMILADDNNKGLHVFKHKGNALTFRWGPSHLYEVIQCAKTELAWDHGTPPYKLSVAFGRVAQNMTEVINVGGLANQSYPLVIRGPSDGVMEAHIRDLLGGGSSWYVLIRPSSDTSCL
ncbi:hypothetical protein BD309DRAFT_961088, partial [Dichomitus squalens]